MSVVRRIVRGGKVQPQSERERPARLRDVVPLRPQAPKARLPIEVMISGLCPHTGDGLLHLCWRTRRTTLVDRKWLVPKGLPGELVRLEFGLVKERKYPRGDLDLTPQLDVQSISRSPYEIPSPCPHFSVCGGCDFLHLRYGRQLVEKQRWAQQELVKRKIPLSVLERIRPSELQQRYVHRTEWVFSESDGDCRLGPAGKGGFMEDEPPLGCVLPQPGVARTLGLVFEAFQQMRALQPTKCSIYDEKRGLGTFKSVAVLCSHSVHGSSERGGRQAQLLVNLVLAREVRDVEGVLRPIAKYLADRAPRALLGVVANVARSKREVMGGRRELLLHGIRYIRQDLLVQVRGQAHEFGLEMGAGTRLCAHPRALPGIVHTVLDMCQVEHGDVVWHCFCGSGELSLPLGAACAHVVAIGTSAAEVSELKRNLRANRASNITSVLANLRSPWTLKELSFHISHSQQRRLLLGTGEEQERARAYVLTTFVPGEGRRRQLQRISAAPFTAPLLRQDALAHQELQALLPAFVRNFKAAGPTTLPAPIPNEARSGEAGQSLEVPPDMEAKLKRLYRRQALKCHPDKNPDDPDAAERFQALTRAYRALVGDTAGPEEGDENAEDPFVKAMSSNYRLKFKHRWRLGNNDQSRWGRASTGAEGDKGAEQEDAGTLQEEVPMPGPREEEESEDEDLTVKLEIDDSWAKADIQVAQVQELAEGPEVTIRERTQERDLAQVDENVPLPTLPPPDVVVVSQPRNRKPGRGTPKHFHSWLRSAAPRRIIYVSIDAAAFAADARALEELGYEVSSVQPFDTEPHQHSMLLVARLDLVFPLKGSEEYLPRGEKMLPGMPSLLPPGTPLPALGHGGYTQARAALK